MNKLTAFTIVKNGQDLLPRMIASLQGVADELVLLDTGSEDDTPVIIAQTAASGNFARVVTGRITFDGFGEAWQRSLDKVDTEWALCIAADETLSVPLRSRIMALKRQGLDDHDGWILHRINTVLGRQMKGRNLSRDTSVRLVRTSKAHVSAQLVHEGLVLAEGSTTGQLTEPLLHNAMDNWLRYLKKVDLYTTLDVRGGRFRFRWWHLLTTGPATFLLHYVGRAGFRDGWPGFVWALTASIGAVMRDWKLLKKAWGRF